MQIDPKNHQALLNRSKAYFLYGMKDKAFLGLKKLSEISNSSQIHYYSALFLMQDNAFHLATQAFANCAPTEEIIINRMKNNILSRELNSAIEDLEFIIDLTSDPKAKIDKECLLALQNASMKEGGIKRGLEILNAVWNGRREGFVFRLHDVAFYKVVLKF